MTQRNNEYEESLNKRKPQLNPLALDLIIVYVSVIISAMFVLTFDMWQKNDDTRIKQNLFNLQLNTHINRDSIKAIYIKQALDSKVNRDELRPECFKNKKIITQ